MASNKHNKQLKQESLEVWAMQPIDGKHEKTRVSGYNQPILKERETK